MDARVVRWWPLIGLPALVLLGLAVGTRSTRVDDWFIRTGAAHRGLHRLLIFTEPPLVVGLLLVAFAAALWRRRWRLAAAMVVTPAVALVAMRVLKRVFGRTKGEHPPSLAFPSGHVTMTVVVLAMVVLVLGARVWAMAAAAVLAVLAALGQAFTYHYFTDTVGALLLATSVVCLAVWAFGLDGCQPRCDLRHRSG